MFFTRLRRQAKWVFVFLALIFGASFVLFGVGTGFGGLQSILTRNSSSSSSSSVSGLRAEIAKHPRHATAYRQLSQALQNNGQVDQAIPPLERYTSLRPHDQAALNQLGTLYLDQLQRAEQQYSVAQASSAQSTLPGLLQPQLGKNQTLPQDPITQAEVAQTDQAINAAQVRLQTVSAKALATYNRLAKVSPRDPAVQLELAQVAESAQNLPAALAAYRAFLKLSPQDPNAPLVRQRITQLLQLSASRPGG